MASSHAALAVTNSASPNGRVAHHKIWGASLIAASDGSKSNRAWMFAESLANFLEEMCLKKTPLLEVRAFLDKEVSILNLPPLDLLLDKMMAQVSAERTATIEDMADMPTTKRSKMSTIMNTIGLCKTKKNVLETIANWLLPLNHNFVAHTASPTLFYSTFFMHGNLSRQAPHSPSMENNKSENQRKKRKLQQEGILKMITRRDFRSPPDLQAQIGPLYQPMTTGCEAI
eukprot:12556814-Ditylum_brightwellii.AAC.1